MKIRTNLTSQEIKLNNVDDYTLKRFLRVLRKLDVIAFKIKTEHLNDLNITTYIFKE